MHYYRDSGWNYTPEERRLAEQCPQGLHIPCRHCSKKKFKICLGRGNYSVEELQALKEKYATLKKEVLDDYNNEMPKPEVWGKYG